MSALQQWDGGGVSYKYGSSKNNQAKFSDTCSVRADGLCIGCFRLVGRRKTGNSSMLEFFCSTLYIIREVVGPFGLHISVS